MKKSTTMLAAALCYMLGTAAVCAQTISAAPMPPSTAPANNFANSIGATGLGYAQPSFPNLSGQATLGQLPNINANSVLGNNTGSPAIPIQLTSAQITAMINQATASLSGALPAWPNSTTTFFRGDGTYQPLNLAAISGIGTMASQNASAVAITGGTAAFTGAVSNTLNQNAVTSFQVANSNSGTGSAAAFVAASDVAGGAFGAASSGYSSLAVLTGRAYVYGTSAAAGVAIDASGSGNPIVLATNDIERGRVLLGLQVGTTTRDAAGVVNAGTGFNIAGTAASGNVLRGNGANFVSAQLGFSDLSGSASASQLPNPTATTLGGIESIVSAAHNWIAYIDTLGVPHQSQPAFTDISGNLATTQLNSGSGASSTTFWRGDGTWQTPSGAGNVSTSGTPVANQIAQWTSATVVQGVNLASLLTGTGGVTVTGTTSPTIKLSFSGAVTQNYPSVPTGTTNATGAMMGLGSSCAITPVNSTRIEFAIHGSVSNSSLVITSLTGRYGTGTAPSNGNTTHPGSIFTNPAPFYGGNSNYQVGTASVGIITGLSPGTTYWFDVEMSVGGGTGSMSGITCNAKEV